MEYKNKLMKCQKEKELESELISGGLLIQLLNRCLYTVMHKGKAMQQK